MSDQLSTTPDPSAEQPIERPTERAGEQPLPEPHWVSDPATGEWVPAGEPRPKRRLARTFAAAVVAAVLAGFSGYAVGHVTADDTSNSTTAVQGDGTEQGFPGGEPPSGDLGASPDTAPDSDSTTSSGTPAE